MNLANWLARAGRARPDAPAIAIGAKPIASYGEFAMRAAQLAAGLRALPGVSAGSRVAILAKNCPEYLEILYGIWWAGLAAVPINAKLHAAEAAWILDHSGASVAFVSDDLDGAIAGHAPDTLKHLVTIGSAPYRKLFQASAYPLALAEPDDLAWLFYTSGTTGRPKGAMLTHRNLDRDMAQAYLSEVDPDVAGRHALHAAPMSHGSGHLHHGACHARSESRWLPNPAASTRRGVRADHAWPRISMFAAPTMIKRLVDSPGECCVRTISVR